MASAWGTFAFLIVLSSLVPFITCPGPETSGTTSASTTNASDTAANTVKPTSTATTTVPNGAQQTPARRCVDFYILRPIRWLIDVPLKTVWNTIVKAKDSLASLYGIPAPKPNEAANKNV